MYIINTSEFEETYNIKIVETNSYVPLDPANSDYQRVLDDIIEQGASCFDGDIPAELQAAADAKQVAQDYSAMGDSVALITDVIAGNCMADQSAEDRQGCVDRNVQHLELMLAKEDWGDEDMTAVETAISAGNGYTAS